MTEPYERTQPTDDGGVIVPPAPDWPPRALDADGDGQPDYREPGVPTQIAHPWRAAVRTALAVLVGLSIVLPIAWQIVGDELAKHGWSVPDNVAAVAAVVIASVSVAAGIVTRIMAIPQVSDLLTRAGIGPTPNTAE